MSRNKELDTAHYSMVIEWEPEGGVFVVTVPELPGCRTHGTTYEKAAKQGQDAIETWIDGARAWGNPIPPRYFDLDSIDASNIGNGVMPSGDDEDEALPYQERIVQAALTKVRDLRR